MPGQKRDPTRNWMWDASRDLTLQWRAGQLPGLRRTWIAVLATPRLQWRAGQLPGQTVERALRHARASMEGRAIARPNLPTLAMERSSSHARPPHASMEGRAIARPNAASSSGARPKVGAASMEGRAIARPNRDIGPREFPGQFASMEGRAIARPNENRPLMRPVASMEGRAIARPNAGRGHFPPAVSASMEGRAIARPKPFGGQG